MRKNMIILLVLSSAGLIFSGYLSTVKLFSGTCAFNESCPYFLGYPACWYGFGMYLAMSVIAVLSLLNKINYGASLKIIFGISAAGIIFAGRFAVLEFISGRFTGVLGFSTCVYGLIFYMAILTTALIGFKKRGAGTQI